MLIQYFHQIHFTGLFLPWHRWYVHSVETALRTKCDFTGASPYWDWSKGSHCLSSLSPLTQSYIYWTLLQTPQTSTGLVFGLTTVLRPALAVGETLHVIIKCLWAGSPTCIYPILPRTYYGGTSLSSPGLPLLLWFRSLSRTPPSWPMSLSRTRK